MVAKAGDKAQRLLTGHPAQAASPVSVQPDAEPFWQFSLVLYPALQHTLLQLQDDYQANINLLLWLAFQAQQPGPAVGALQQALAPTHQQFTAPLRQLRRQAAQQGLLSLKQTLLAAELQAERQEQQALLACYQTWLATGAPDPTVDMGREASSTVRSEPGTDWQDMRQYLTELQVPATLQQSLLFDLDQVLSQLSAASR